MQLNIQELQTIRHYEIPLKVFVINNKVLGNTKAWQVVNNRAQIACGPDGYSTPDFGSVAHAYEIWHDMMTQEWDLSRIGSLLAQADAAVIDVIDEDRCTYEPRISRFDLPIEDMYPQLPDDEFKAQMIVPHMRK
jgi:acetolactate synthase-1/2/3 large subunit